MDVRDFGTLIWAIFIIIAIISSILRSANRALKSAQQQPQPRPQPPPPPPSAPEPALSPLRVSGVAGLRMTAVPSAVSSVSPRTFGRETSDRGAGADAGATRPTSRGDLGGRAPVRYAFTKGSSQLVQGIIALEVLGPPRALREWKPIA
jgi:hypothetical protein